MDELERSLFKKAYETRKSKLLILLVTGCITTLSTTDALQFLVCKKNCV